jgi:uncharacterized membrane protein
MMSAYRSAALSLLLMLAALSCGGGGHDSITGTITPPAPAATFDVVAPATSVQPGQIVSVVVRRLVVPAAGASGTLGGTPVTAARLTDSTLAFIVPVLSAGSAPLALQMGSAQGLATISLAAAPVYTGAPEKYVGGVIDSVAAVSVVSHPDLAARVAEVRQRLAALSPADQQLVAQIIATHRAARASAVSGVPSAQRATSVVLLAATSPLASVTPGAALGLATTPPRSNTFLGFDSRLAGGVALFSVDAAAYVAATTIAAGLTAASSPVLAGVATVVAAYYLVEAVSDAWTYVMTPSLSYETQEFFSGYSDLSDPSSNSLLLSTAPLRLTASVSAVGVKPAPSASAAVTASASSLAGTLGCASRVGNSSSDGTAAIQPAAVLCNNVASLFLVMGSFQRIGRSDTTDTGPVGAVARSLLTFEQLATLLASAYPPFASIPGFPLPATGTRSVRILPSDSLTVTKVAPAQPYVTGTVNGQFAVQFAIPGLTTVVPESLTVAYGTSGDPSTQRTFGVLVTDLAALAIRPLLPNVEVGRQVVLHAIAVRADGSAVPNRVTAWTISDTHVASLLQLGDSVVVTGLVPGAVRIGAIASHLSASDSVVVGPALDWMPQTLSAPSGTVVLSAVNATGQVSGWVDTQGASVMGKTAFVWSPAGGRRDLPAVPGYSSTQANAIGDDGTVIGFGYSSQDELNRPTAVFWPRGGAPVILATPPFGKVVLTAVNATGQMSGWVDMKVGNVPTRTGFVVSPAGGRRDLPAVPGYSSTQADAIGDDGTVIGGASTGFFVTGSNIAVIWPRGGSPVVIPAPTGSIIQLTGVNADGQVAGFVRESGTLGATAFVWSPTSGRRDLPGAPGFTNSAASGIGADGTVIGSAVNYSVSAVATASAVVIWPRGGAPVVLSAPVGSIIQVSAVNAAGQVAGSVTEGVATGVTVAFVWSPAGGRRDLRGAPGFARTSASGIGDDGTVIGSALNYSTSVGTTTAAVIWVRK